MVRRSFCLIITVKFYYTYIHSGPCYQEWYKSGPWSRKGWEPLIYTNFIMLNLVWLSVIILETKGSNRKIYFVKIHFTLSIIAQHIECLCMKSSVSDCKIYCDTINLAIRDTQRHSCAYRNTRCRRIPTAVSQSCCVKGSSEDEKISNKFAIFNIPYRAQ